MTRAWRYYLALGVLVCAVYPFLGKETAASTAVYLAVGASGVVAATGLAVTLLKSGPLGGDAQLGAMIAEGRLDALVFFQDPLTSMPHDVDVKALTRLATLYNVLFAVNEATADAVLAVL